MVLTFVVDNSLNSKKVHGFYTYYFLGQVCSFEHYEWRLESFQKLLKGQLIEVKVTLSNMLECVTVASDREPMTGLRFQG